VLEKAPFQEPAQHPLDGGAEWAMLLGEAVGVDAEKLPDVLLDEAAQRRLARPPRPVDPARDLHAQPEAGGRGTGG
jgi:hypothetical protein